jgi:hypothetical protein
LSNDAIALTKVEDRLQRFDTHYLWIRAMRVRTRFLSILFVIFGSLLIGTAGCGGSQEGSDSSGRSGNGGASEGEARESAPMTRRSQQGASRPPRVRYGNLNRAAMSTRQTDVNQDGTADQVEYFRDGTLFFVERDLDFDGTPDLFEYFNAAGELIEQEFQLDYDLAIDAVRFYDNGQVTEKLVSTEFDGGATIWKYYNEDGTLSRLERDTDSDGVLDEWSYYEDGEVARIEEDTDGDGQPDTEVDSGN